MINNPAIMIYMENIDDKVNVSVLYNEPKEYIEINKNIVSKFIPFDGTGTSNN